MKHTTIGKHLLTILLSLVMACALCAPAMALEVPSGAQIDLPRAVDGVITLTSDVYLSAQATVPAGVTTIEGNGKTIYAAAGTWSTDNDSKALLLVNTDDVTIRNVVLDSQNIAYGLQVYCADDVTLNNVTLNNGKGAGLNVNASTVKATDKLTMSGNEWDSVNVGWGSGIPSGRTSCSFDASAVTDMSTVQAVYADAGDEYNAGDVGKFSVSMPAGYESVVTPGLPVCYAKVGQAVAQIGETKYATLAAAVGAAQNGETVNLLHNVLLEEPIKIYNDLIVDLGGNQIDSSETNTKKNDSTIFSAFNGNVMLKNGQIKGRVNSYDSATLTIANGLTVQGIVVVWGDGTYGVDGCKTPTLNVYGKVINESDQAISTNGTDYSQPIINVYDGAEVRSTDDGGMYIPNVGVVNVYGGTIAGKGHAIGIKCGTLNVNGGTLQATGPDETPTEGFSNGMNASGAAIQIESNVDYKINGSTPGVVNVYINGGVIESQNGYAIYEYVDSKTKNTQTDSISIVNGNIRGAKGVILISQELAAKNAISVSGGTFSADVKDYCANGYYSVHTDENEWTVLPAGSLPITLDIASVSKIEGEKEPAFSVSTKDKVAYGDDINNYFVCTRDKGEAVGTYTIHAVENNLPKYYKVIGTNQGTLTIMPKPGTETGTTDTVVVPEPPKVDESANPSAEAKKVAENLKVDEEAVALNGVEVAKELETSGKAMEQAEEKLADVRAEGDTILLVVKPYVEIKPTTIETSADGKVQKVNLEITMKYDVQATIPGKKTVEISTGNTMSKEQIKADTTITVPVPTGFATTEAFVRHVTGDNNVYYYSTKLTDGKFEFTVPAEHGFSPFTLMSNSNVTVKLDGKDYTYTSLDVVNGTALPAASKFNYAFKGWKFEGVDGQHFNMTAELFEALLDKNAVVIGSSVFEGPMSEHPEIEEAKKNGTWGVDENKPAATAKPAAAAVVTPVRSSIPKTSDDSNLMLWVCLMGIAALGLGGAVYMKKRNH